MEKLIIYLKVLDYNCFEGTGMGFVPGTSGILSNGANQTSAIFSMGLDEIGYGGLR